jgi:hypothetical protein
VKRSTIGRVARICNQAFVMCLFYAFANSKNFLFYFLILEYFLI